jgi:hypothetical protein
MRGLPTAAAWRHEIAREGFEVVFLSTIAAGGLRLEGYTSAVEDGVAWAVRYVIETDATWCTRSAHIHGHFGRRVVLHADGEGHWHVDGTPAPELDGCFDVDLESSACTNTLPIHRLELAVGAHAEAPAAYVRADLQVERLEQRYERTTATHYAYAAPAFAYADTLLYDEHGLIIDYPGIAARVPL